MVAPHDPSTIPFDAAQAMVNAIWEESGLRYPPEVEPLPRQARNLLADATRLRIRLPDNVPSWHLLHELAHAMTSTHEGETDGHGPNFVGVYVSLLVKYLRLSEETLLASLKAEGIQVAKGAKPSFLD